MSELLSAAASPTPSAGTSAPMGLYVHIPFCVKKCFYCDFNSGPSNSNERRLYLESLSREIHSTPWRGKPIRTLFFGGGTPSELSLTELARLLDDLAAAFEFADCGERTIECNPGTVDDRYFEGLLELGFNRISLGVQSFDDAHLMGLGRIHTAAEARRAVASARAAGVDNLNLDLIYGLHGQTLAEWEQDLEQALRLQPEHLSLYALMIEPGTDFGRRSQAGLLPVIDDDLVADMFELNRRQTAEAGFEQYEISNFCRPRRQSLHNLLYWRNDDYLGLGVGASSFVQGYRWSNTANQRRYCTANPTAMPRCSSERLRGPAAAGEAAMLGLRTSEGISVDGMSRRYGIDFEQTFQQQLNLLLAHQLLDRQQDRLRLTPAGQLLASEVGMRFLR